jgi:hypothetical protein
MSDIQVAMHVDGERVVIAKYSAMPGRTRRILRRRITALSRALQGGVRAAIPVRKSPRWPSALPALAQFIVSKVYADNPARVAGYVSVYAPSNPAEYAKAATLEYGSTRPRAVRDEARGVMRRLRGSSRRIRARLGKPAVIRAYRYLRGPLGDMRAEVVAALEEGIVEAVTQVEA